MTTGTLSVRCAIGGQAAQATAHLVRLLKQLHQPPREFVTGTRASQRTLQERRVPGHGSHELTEGCGQLHRPGEGGARDGRRQQRQRRVSERALLRRGNHEAVLCRPYYSFLCQQRRCLCEAASGPARAV